VWQSPSFISSPALKRKKSSSERLPVGVGGIVERSEIQAETADLMDMIYYPNLYTLNNIYLDNLGV
jgi:hypothetical protein